MKHYGILLDEEIGLWAKFRDGSVIAHQSPAVLMAYLPSFHAQRESIVSFEDYYGYETEDAASAYNKAISEHFSRTAEALKKHNTQEAGKGASA